MEHRLAAGGAIDASSSCLLCPVPMVSSNLKNLKPAATGVANQACKRQGGRKEVGGQGSPGAGVSWGRRFQVERVSREVGMSRWVE